MRQRQRESSLHSYSRNDKIQVQEIAAARSVIERTSGEGDFVMIRKLLILTIIFGAAVAGFGAGFLHAQNASSQESHPAPAPALYLSRREVSENRCARLSRRAAQRPITRYAGSRAVSGRANSQHLHACGESETSPLSGAMLLRLRQGGGAQEPAGLLHRSSRRPLHALQKRSGLHLLGIAARKNRRADSQGNHQTGNGKRWTCPNTTAPVLPTNSLAAYSGRREEHPLSARSNSSPPLQLYPRTFHSVASRLSASIMASRSD